jgi:hypothetical protein
MRYEVDLAFSAPTQEVWTAMTNTITIEATKRGLEEVSGGTMMGEGVTVRDLQFETDDEAAAIEFADWYQSTHADYDPEAYVGVTDHEQEDDDV